MLKQKTLLPAITATSLMTLFSYLIAEYEKKNFSEAELLSKIEKNQFHLPETIALPAGWTTHYAVGVLMTLLFETYKLIFKKKPAFYDTVIFGTFAGLLAIVSWKQLFKMLPKRQHNFYRKFYIQLFVAHLIFAATVTTLQKQQKELLPGDLTL